MPLLVVRSSEQSPSTLKRPLKIRVWIQGSLRVIPRTLRSLVTLEPSIRWKQSNNVDVTLSAQSSAARHLPPNGKWSAYKLSNCWPIWSSNWPQCFLIVLNRFKFNYLPNIQRLGQNIPGILKKNSEQLLLFHCKTSWSTGMCSMFQASWR